MIFKTSPKAPTDDNPSVAMPANQAVTPNDDQMQDDQELAKVLADINNQVNANNDNLAVDLECAMNEETTAEATTAEPTTEDGEIVCGPEVIAARISMNPLGPRI